MDDGWMKDEGRMKDGNSDSLEEFLGSVRYQEEDLVQLKSCDGLQVCLGMFINLI